MTISTWAMLVEKQAIPDIEPYPILIRGDNVALVTWANRCVWEEIQRSGVFHEDTWEIRFSRRVKSPCETNSSPKKNVWADDILRLRQGKVDEKLKQFTNDIE